MQGWRIDMEDAHHVQISIGKEPPFEVYLKFLSKFINLSRIGLVIFCRLWWSCRQQSCLSFSRKFASNIAWYARISTCIPNFDLLKFNKFSKGERRIESERTENNRKGQIANPGGNAHRFPPAGLRDGITARRGGKRAKWDDGNLCNPHTRLHILRKFGYANNKIKLV